LLVITDGATGHVVSNIFNTLVRYDAKMQIVPDLATSWRTEDDGRAVDFFLRQGVKFHDGTDFDAAAVKFAFDRILDPANSSPYRTFFKPIEQVVVIAVTAVLCAALFALFRYSKLGIAMQASSQNQLAAYYMGIPVRQLNGLVWALAAMVAGVAGILLAPITFVHANMGFIGLKAFPAAVVGGFGSLPGAIVGGLIIGVVESMSGFYLPPGFKDVAAYVVVLLMLMLRPNGLFGEKLRKKV
jgi:branched-subunit amino acid ABC-type transport system permease component